MQIPLTAYELIELLDRLYPEVIYDPERDRAEFLLRSGERRLVLQLKAWHAAEAAHSNV